MIFQIGESPRNQNGVLGIVKTCNALFQRSGGHRLFTFEKKDGGFPDQKQRGFMPLAKVGGHLFPVLAEHLQALGFTFRHRGTPFVVAVLTAAGWVEAPGGT